MVLSHTAEGNPKQKPLYYYYNKNNTENNYSTNKTILKRNLGVFCELSPIQPSTVQKAFFITTDYTGVNQSDLYNMVHRELPSKAQKRPMRKICKMLRCLQDSISKANMHSFVLFHTRMYERCSPVTYTSHSGLYCMYTIWNGSRSTSLQFSYPENRSMGENLGTGLSVYKQNWKNVEEA